MQLSIKIVVARHFMLLAASMLIAMHLHRHGVKWCVTNLSGVETMASKGETNKPVHPIKAPRQSVTFTPSTYAELERLSKEKKVSIAWVVREATEKYIADQCPLFGRAG
jgi:hypothetical protein